MAKIKLIKCKACGAEIAHNAKTCPHCGAKNKKPFYTKAWFWIFAVIVLLAASGGSGKEEPSVSNDTQPVIVPQESVEQTNENAQLATEATKETIPAETGIPMTAGQKNALRSAESYLRIMAFSYEGLIEQLEYDQYSHEDATFAAENCGADWNEQALKSAKNYLDMMAFSYKGLVDQLKFEHFTADQATYAADNCGADWSEQAVKSAANYLDLMGFSRDGLIEQLVYDGFTQEQAVRGAEENGL